MKPIVFTCPTTGIPVITGVLCEDAVMDVLLRVPANIECRLCGEVHFLTLRRTRRTISPPLRLPFPRSAQ